MMRNVVPLQTVSDNQHGQLSRVDTQYDFIGNVLKQRKSHGVTANTTDVLETVNTYDDRSRLLTATSTLNGGTPAIVTYKYDSLGRLITKKYGNKVTEQMAYNIRGWLTSKESEPFKMKLHYEAPVAGATACYNGNISEWEWQQGTHTAQLYGFTYDPVSRLKEANQQKKEGSNWITNINHYVEKGITYDRNGNILTLRRTANGTMIDNLLYGYTGNRLTSLIESVRGLIPGDIYQSGLLPNGIYEYDANGNMIKDSRKSLTFNYNALNLLGIVKENNVVKANYRYLADGTKQSIRNGNGDTGYDYDGSFVYTVTNGMSTLDAAHFADGQLKSTGVNYVLTDHLGSVRTLVDANGTILEQNDFYPFGSKHTNEAYASNSSNRFLFSGKERQDLLDLNTYDFGARMYDSSIARWAAVDPLCEDCYSLSLYNYCGNNPISFVDFFGMDYWSTSNPALISLFLNTIRQGDANVYGRSSISFNLSAWEHLTDNDFIAGLSYNDETGMFYWNTANIVNGEWIITGHSLSNRIYGLPAIKDNQLHFSYYNENKALSASGKLDNNDLDFQILTLGRLKATEVSIALTQSLISRIWRPKYTLESLISKVSTHTRTGDPQAFVKGDAYKIFQQVIKTGKNTGDNQYLMPDGTTVKLYKASSNGLPTIFIDKGVVKYKIRITQ